MGIFENMGELVFTEIITAYKISKILLFESLKDPYSSTAFNHMYKKDNGATSFFYETNYT